MIAYVKTAETASEERERLILEHLPQVRLIARRIHERVPQSVCLDDLVSAGILGLIGAVDNYDPSHQVKLKTYAEYKIRGAILDSLRELDWAPRPTRQRARQVEEAIAVLEQQLGGPPGEEEIAAKLSLSLAEYQEWLAEARGLQIASLDAGFGEENGRDLLRCLPDSEDHSPAQELERSELERVLADAIERMPTTDRTVLSLYYLEELTLKEIAEVLKVHEARVSQLKSQAILRLRSYLNRKWPMQKGGGA